MQLRSPRKEVMWPSGGGFKTAAQSAVYGMQYSMVGMGREEEEEVWNCRRRRQESEFVY